MTILIIDGSVAFTGAFKCALNEAELLSSEHKFIFILPARTTLSELLLEKGFTVYNLPMKEISRSLKSVILYSFYLVKNLLALKQIARKESADVIQVNDFYNLLGAAMKLTGYKGKLITYIRFLPSALPAPLRKLWTKIAQHYSDSVIAVSDAVLNQLPARPNTIRIYDPIALEERLVKPGKSSEVIQCTYIANYTRGKGQEYALAAFTEVYKSDPGIRLKFVGGDMGLEKNALFKKELEQSALQNGLGNVVSFHPFNPDAEKEIKDADIILNFSDAESFSMTCLEAAFYGTPLIATRCGGPEEIIQDQVTGLLVPKRDVRAMAEAILRLSGDASIRRQYAANGEKYVREKFTREQFIHQFTQLLK